MKPFLIAASLLVLSAFCAGAQSVKTPQPDSVIKTIPFGEGRHAGYLYTIGGKLQTREDVIIRLMAYAPSDMEYNKARNNLTWAYVSGTGFAVSALASVIEFGKNNKDAGATTGIVNGQAAIIYQKHNLTGAYVLTGAATAFLFSTIFNLARAAIHSNNAINLYNQQYQ